MAHSCVSSRRAFVIFVSFSAEEPAVAEVALNRQRLRPGLSNCLLKPWLFPCKPTRSLLRPSPMLMTCCSFQYTVPVPCLILVQSQLLDQDSLIYGAISSKGLE